MKKIINKAIKTIAGIVVGFGIGLGIASANPVVEQVEVIKEIPVVEYVEKEVSKVDVEFTWVQEGNEQELEGFHLENGDLLTVLTDGSYSIVNESQGIYFFQPVDLGDWDVSLESSTQVEKIIATYMSIKNTGMY